MTRLQISAALAATLAVVLVAQRSDAAQQLPDGFVRCPKDKSWPKCLESALSHALKKLAPGIPEFGLPPLSPLKIPRLEIGGDNRQRPVNININFTNIVGYGLENAYTISDTCWEDLDHYKFGCKGQANALFIDADYTMNGRILLLPATGEGKVKLNFTNLIADLAVEGEEKVKKGQVHMKVNSFKNDLDVQKLEVHFDNLFNGDKTLGDSINSLLNENWRDLWGEIKGPLELTLSPTFKEYSRRIFDKVTWEDVFLPSS